MKEVTVLYRYYDYPSDDSLIGVRIRCDSYNVIKRTPRGYWIGNRIGSIFRDDKKRWVSSSSRKRFAYPTKKEALVSLIARKRLQIRILKYQLNGAEDALIKGMGILEALKGDVKR